MRPVAHHGTIRFYDSLEYSPTQSIWVEFVAYFIYGKLDKVAIYDVTLHDSFAVTNQRWEEERAAREKLLWNRVKRVLNYVGWRWFWSKFVLKASGQISRAISKFEQFVYRNIL